MKKTKKQARKSLRKVRNLQQPSSGNNVENLHGVQNTLVQKNGEKNTINTKEEKATVKLIEEKKFDENSQENVKINYNESEAQSQTLHANVAVETNISKHQAVSWRKEADELPVQKDELNRITLEEAFVVKKVFSFHYLY